MAIQKKLGLFITLEGPEGSGKSTQAARLAAHLRGQGRQVLLTREPGGTPVSEQIRGLIINHANAELHPHAEFLLFCASRTQLVHQVIRPHLAMEGTVVCDRFSDSTLAYQGFGRGLDLQMLDTVNRFAADGLTPDITFLLDLPVEIGLERRKLSGGEWNRMDAQTLAFHQRVRDGYLALAQKEPARWARVDASVDTELVWDQIHAALDRFLSHEKNNPSN
jgi:dTMP kinase